MPSTDSEGYPYDPRLDVEHDRNLGTGGESPESSGEPQQAPWPWKRVHVTQEILDDLELEDKKGCSALIGLAFALGTLITFVYQIKAFVA